MNAARTFRWIVGFSEIIRIKKRKERGERTKKSYGEMQDEKERDRTRYLFPVISRVFTL